LQRWYPEEHWHRGLGEHRQNGTLTLASLPRQATIVKRILLAQLLATVALPFGFAIGGFSAACSALSGGLICLVPNAYFARRMFRHTGARAASQIVRSFYAAEAGKLAFTAILFGVIFATVEWIVAPALFAGFIAVQIVSWLVPLLWK